MTASRFPPLDSLRWTESLMVHHAMEVAQLDGDYVEFGVYRGATFIQAYYAAMHLVVSHLEGRWSAGKGKDDPDELMARWANNCWDWTRFIGFDSFQGVPKPGAIDAIDPVFREGSYAASKDEFLAALTAAGVDLKKVRTVEGFFDRSLTPEAAAKIHLKRISVCLIDSDLYESAKAALDFCTPYFRDGSIVIFDEWFQFRGHPQLGEQRAFAEWRAENPDWLVQEFLTEAPYRKSFILSRPLAG